MSSNASSLAASAQRARPRSRPPLFAIAHLDVYRVAICQIVPLGIACGIAFEEGGLIAAVVTHAMWNLHLLV